jgi:hypothetical protein
MGAEKLTAFAEGAAGNIEKTPHGVAMVAPR